MRPRLGVVMPPGGAVDAAALAERLGCPCYPVAAAAGDCEFLLSWDGGRLQLAPPGAARGLTVDFAAPEWRRRSAGADLASRAVAGRSRRALEVVDATAGLGRDAFALASRGHRVRMVELSPVVAALLEDGLLRARADPALAAVAARLDLVCGDARVHLASADADVVYLDPMFNRGPGERALPGRAIQWLQRLLDAPAAEEAALLDAARGAARLRVVIKRARRAPAFAQEAPAYTLQGRSVRFDVHVAT